MKPLAPTAPATSLARPVAGARAEDELGRGDYSAGLVECVANVSEGRDARVVASLAEACGPCLLDVHSDPFHNRSVITLAGDKPAVAAGARHLARSAVQLLDLGRHSGAHPRFGVLDVVPWVGLEGWPLRDANPGSSIAQTAEEARDEFAAWAATELALPVFLYGPQLSLPDVRRRAWHGLPPDFGPAAPHPTAGSVAVGVRPLLVAYNLWMGEEVSREQAKAIATALRGPEVRSLALRVGACYQVSCNLLRPLATGPADVFDDVACKGRVERAELVGLVPRAVLEAVPEDRWAGLGLAPSLTIESRLSVPADGSAARRGVEVFGAGARPREG